MLLATTQHNLDASQWALAEEWEQGPGGPMQQLPFSLLTCEGSLGSQGKSRSSWDSRGELWTMVIYLLEQKHF